MQYTGRVTHIGEVEKIGEKKTPKITIVLEEITDREYPGSLAVDFWGDKTKLLDKYSIQLDNVVTAHINSRSREHKGRHYNSISAWKIVKDESHIDNAESEDLPF